MSTDARTYGTQRRNEPKRQGRNLRSRVYGAGALALLLLGGGCGEVRLEHQPHFFVTNFLDGVIDTWPLDTDDENIVKLGVKTKERVLARSYRGQTFSRVERDLGNNGIYCEFDENDNALSCQYCVLKLQAYNDSFVTWHPYYEVDSFYWLLKFSAREKRKASIDQPLEAHKVQNVVLRLGHHSELAKDENGRYMTGLGWTEAKRDHLCDRARQRAENMASIYGVNPIEVY
jgi:hypothetical protein